MKRSYKHPKSKTENLKVLYHAKCRRAKAVESINSPSINTKQTEYKYVNGLNDIRQLNGLK